MEITDKNEHARIMNECGELQDGLWLFAGQAQYALDTHCCDGAYWFVTEFKHKRPHGPELCNFSYMNFAEPTDLFSEYEETGVYCYTTAAEMHAHVARFAAERNHF